MGKAPLRSGETDNVDADRAARIPGDLARVEAARVDELQEFRRVRIDANACKEGHPAPVPQELGHAPTRVERVAGEASPVEVVADRRELDHGFANPDDIAVERLPSGQGRLLLLQ
jgi:hypothetical protein